MSSEFRAIKEQLDNAIAIQCYKSFYSFFLVFWEVIEPTMPLKLNWHLKYLCDEAQYIIERLELRLDKEYDLIISIAPGETKSTIFSRMLPAWVWLRDASLKIISGSYDYSLATSFTVKSRDIILSKEYQDILKTLEKLQKTHEYAEALKHFKTFRLKGDQNVKSYYDSTNGGMRIASSPGSRITGFHADLQIIDDSVKPPSPAQGVGISYTDIQSAIHWVGKVLSSRKTDRKKSVTIYVQQRVAKKDVTNHLLRTLPSVKHIRLPATDKHPIEPPDLIRYYKNGLMNPFTTDDTVIQEKILTMTASGWIAQFEQNPEDEGGGIWKSEWFGRFKMADIPGDTIWHTITDTASTTDTSNSSTGMLCYAYIKGVFYVRSFKAKWVQADQLGYEYIKFHIENGYNPVASKAEIEPKANGISFAQLMRNEDIVQLSVKELEKKGIAAKHIKRINTKAFDNVIIGEIGTDKKQQVRYLSMSKSDKALHVSNTIRRGSVKLLEESELPYGENWQLFLEAAEDFPNTGITEVIDTVSYMIVSNEAVASGALFTKFTTGSYVNQYKKEAPIHLMWLIEPTVGRYRCIALQLVQVSHGEAAIIVHDEFEFDDLKKLCNEVLDVYANHIAIAVHYHIVQPSATYTQLAEMFSPRNPAYVENGCKFQSMFNFTGKITALQTISGSKQKTTEQIAARANAFGVLLSGGYKLKMTAQFAGNNITVLIDINCLKLTDAVRSLQRDFNNIDRYGDWVNCLSLGVSKILEAERELFKY